MLVPAGHEKSYLDSWDVVVGRENGLDPSSTTFPEFQSDDSWARQSFFRFFCQLFSHRVALPVPSPARPQFMETCFVATGIYTVL
ncbi:hypothetical protein OUZ56_022834 [Daphnia magna]|uniref:Uncharacterized protein n=1 Tax=Daphnia magna TaxID=35525 RepID=A0ABR0AXL1_9CRUS|nr:hypothetical protein OUZ56_022834 [Daphnia magna]